MILLNNLFSESTIDAWISGLGSFLGALIAGIITAGVAIWIMNRQRKHQEEILKKQELKEVLNNYKLIVSNITILLEFLDAIKGSISFLKFSLYETKTRTINDIKDRGDEVKSIILSFDRINESKIDKDIINKYLEIRTNNIYIINFINTTNSGANEESLKRLNKYINSYISTRATLIEKINALEDNKEK